jgi:hypothetical protein
LLSNEDLRDILLKSRFNNAKLGITGMLLYHDGSILQILEGEPGNVEMLFQKIGRDNRHSNVFKMMEFESEHRNFEEWSMGFKQLSGNDWSQLEGCLDLKHQKNLMDSLESKSLEIVMLVKSFAQVNLRYA